jgi:nitrite reductase (NADH) small subunit
LLYSRFIYQTYFNMFTELEKYKKAEQSEEITWFKAASVSAFPENGGACVKYKDLQIAVFNFTRRNEWYACQNLCPHKMQMALSRGMIGSCGEEPKVACPFHKMTFSLKNGNNLDGDECSIITYPVKVEDGFVFIGFDQNY